jgi:CDP-diglyceride synthetase
VRSSPPPPAWSWPEFAVGAAVGLVAACVLWWLLRLALFVLLLGAAIAIAIAVLGGRGQLRWVRRR